MDAKTAAVMIRSILDVQDQIDRDMDVARAIGTLIYEVNTTKSGFVSKSLVDKNGFRVSGGCEEHYNSRQQSAYKIMDANPDIDGIVEMLTEFSKVHLVTSEENIKLSPIQNGADTRDLSWQEQYKLAGIELVEDRGAAPRYYYACYWTPDGQLGQRGFDTIEEASRDTGLSYDELRKRCKSKAKKWERYNVEPITNEKYLNWARFGGEYPFKYAHNGQSIPDVYAYAK